MNIPPESIEAGRCYLVEAKHVWRVVQILPDGRIQYEARLGYQPNVGAWKFGTMERSAFAAQAERKVPCDWTPKKTSSSHLALLS